MFPRNMQPLGLIKAFLFLTLTTVLTACGGGGSGGGGSSSPAPTYLRVVSISPTGNDVAVSSEVRIEFSAAVDRDSLINTRAPIGRVLAEVGIELTNLTAGVNGTPVNQEDVTIQNLVDGLYAPSFNDTLLEDIEINWAGNNNDLVITATGLTNPITVPKALLDQYDVFVQDVIQVNEGSANGPAIDMDIVSVSSNSRVFTLRPTDNFFKWETSYHIFISNLIMDTSSPQRSMEAPRTASFRTPDIPDAEIVDAFPQGGSASVFTDITITPNFETDPATLANNLHLFKVVTQGGTEQDEPVNFTYRYSDSTRSITITPDTDAPEGELDYSSNYKVVVDGGDAGVTGEFDGLLPGILPEDFEFTFQTAAPGVSSVSPSNGAEGINPEGLASLVEITMNFRPESTSANINSVLLEGPGGVPVDSIIETSGRVISITPRSNLDYNTEYTVRVTSDVESDRSDQDIRLANEFTSTFTTQPRRVNSSSISPAYGAVGIDRDNVRFSFSTNFDLNPSGVSSNTGIEVTSSREPGGPYTDPVSFTCSLSNSRDVSCSVNGQLEYYTTLNVRLTSQLAGPLGGLQSTRSQWTFRTENGNFNVIDYAPRGDDVELSESIVVQFSGAHDPDASNFDGQSLSGSSDDVIAVQAINCLAGSNGYIGGDLTWDTNRIFFNPAQNLESICDYRVTVSRDIIGEDNARQEGVDINEFSWTFETVNLEAVRATADFIDGSDVVYIDSTFTVEFDRAIDDSYDSRYGVRIRRRGSSSWIPSTNTVSGSTVRIVPDSLLDVNEEYEIVADAIDTDSTPSFVRGRNGEQLRQDAVYSFRTEPQELYVVDYYPLGNDVYVDSEIEIVLNVSQFEEGFPTYDTFLSPSGDETVYRITVEDEDGYDVDGDISVSGDTIYFTPDDFDTDSGFLLEYDTIYYVTFEVEYPFDSGSYTFEWSFLTEPEPLATTTASARIIGTGGSGSGIPIAKPGTGSAPPSQPGPGALASRRSTQKLSNNRFAPGGINLGVPASTSKVTRIARGVGELERSQPALTTTASQMLRKGELGVQPITTSVSAEIAGAKQVTLDLTFGTPTQAPAEVESFVMMPDSPIPSGTKMATSSNRIPVNRRGPMMADPHAVLEAVEEPKARVQ